MQGAGGEKGSMGSRGIPGNPVSIHIFIFLVFLPGERIYANKFWLDNNDIVLSHQRKVDFL